MDSWHSRGRLHQCGEEHAVFPMVLRSGSSSVLAAVNLQSNTGLAPLATALLHGAPLSTSIRGSLSGHRDTLFRRHDWLAANPVEPMLGLMLSCALHGMT